MRVLIACSSDRASVNMRDCLLSLGSWDMAGRIWGTDAHILGDTLLCMKDGLHLDFNSVDDDLLGEIKTVMPDLFADSKRDVLDHIVFASKHRSERFVDSLTVHAPGNYLEARYGGRAATLPPSSPRDMSAALRALSQAIRDSDMNERASFEVTHHGPYLNTPSFFIEIGSDENRWASRELGELVASSLLDRTGYRDDIPIAIGIGGGHYAPRFTDIALRSLADFGHMVPDHQMFEGIDPRALASMAKSSTPGCNAYALHRTSRNMEAMMDLEPYLQDQGLIPVQR